MAMRAHNLFHSGVEMDSQQQQFCLKWNSFGSNLATSFSNLFKSETLADVTLFCDGVTFKAHKLILAACSKHLADLFETAPLHQNLLVILDNTSATNMSALLEFMYKGEVHVSQDSLSSFLKAAECLQVKGLSIEHEKLAVAQSHNITPMDSGTDSPGKHIKVPKEEIDTPVSNTSHHQSSPSPSYSPTMSPYMHPHHYRPYEPRMATPGAPYGDNAMKRPLRSPSDLMQDNRVSVLRDGSKAVGRPGSPGQMCAYRPSSSLSNLPSQPGGDSPPESRFDPDPATALICPESNTLDRFQDPGCPEDLRKKMEPAMQQDESPSSTAGNGNGNTGNMLNNITSANGSIGSQTNYNHDRDKDLIQANIWSTVAGKMNCKAGTVNTADGKKLKCPFCERLYGYETNLRAHIRQRHQGIRVPCPFCSRTFTRNNTVRRHIAREHKTELSLKAYQQNQQQAAQQQQQVHNHNP
ncbi:zinc finger protein chinmo isoform X2 [Diabrotica virgifera virgifera]|uniref:Zinc finger protein chinmo isoform X1 n=2 Tax=Diabrotica virgifera virgifera TaxID=50390 RepID=A0A6P7FWZ1_DIAVI|nr:zinc finger protein chinmo isoform X1 [Diabrotica virgifera virgifera]XP_050516884.1 zinc finger protein chinmo isoform X2 [Diabrotica virgifera virgifera]